MLSRLYIKNYAIIDEITLDFSKGLTIITGETGAGKSIILGALELILGKRADLKTLKDPAEKCIVEATFQISKYDIASYFKQADLDYADTTIVRRELFASGKSRAFVNDTPTTLVNLQTLCDNLIDMHRQFATQDINNVSFQLRMLDSLANNSKLLGRYQIKYKSYQKKLKQLEELQTRANTSDKAQDFLKFQLSEFEEINIQAGEVNLLEKERKGIENAESIQNAYSDATLLLSENPDNIMDQLRRLCSSFTNVAEVNDHARMLSEKLTSTLLELEDIAAEISGGQLEPILDQERLADINNRLDVIYRMFNKHHKRTEEELLQLYQELNQQLSSFENLAYSIDHLKEEISALAEEMKGFAKELSSKRKSVIEDFVNDVHRKLFKMNMESARLQISISTIESFNLTGLDLVEFLFSTNPGSPFLPVKSIASGGELSRLTLAVKSKVADAIPLPTLVYDEIDTGISGGTAMHMGQILESLAKKHQVIVITHTPQIAVRADKHLFVSKHSKDKTTTTRITELEGEQRIRAIAMMLSGDPPSEAAIENARQLITETS
ncbi:MAG: DNA repair protein RecN [Bacteroidia bacterium]|nr:DNA repair protein RecN [Bacteroidia bacterium]